MIDIYYLPYTFLYYPSPSSTQLPSLLSPVEGMGTVLHYRVASSHIVLNLWQILTVLAAHLQFVVQHVHGVGPCSAYRF